MPGIPGVIFENGKVRYLDPRTQLYHEKPWEGSIPHTSEERKKIHYDLLAEYVSQNPYGLTKNNPVQRLPGGAIAIYDPEKDESFKASWFTPQNPTEVDIQNILAKHRGGSTLGRPVQDIMNAGETAVPIEPTISFAKQLLRAPNESDRNLVTDKVMRAVVGDTATNVLNDSPLSYLLHLSPLGLPAQRLSQITLGPIENAINRWPAGSSSQDNADKLALLAKTVPLLGPVGAQTVDQWNKGNKLTAITTPVAALLDPPAMTRLATMGSRGTKASFKSPRLAALDAFDTAIKSGLDETAAMAKIAQEMNVPPEILANWQKTRPRERVSYEDVRPAYEVARKGVAETIPQLEIPKLGTEPNALIAKTELGKITDQGTRERAAVLAGRRHGMTDYDSLKTFLAYDGRQAERAIREIGENPAQYSRAMNAEELKALTDSLPANLKPGERARVLHDLMKGSKIPDEEIAKALNGTQELDLPTRHYRLWPGEYKRIGSKKPETLKQMQAYLKEFDTSDPNAFYAAVERGEVKIPQELKAKLAQARQDYRQAGRVMGEIDPETYLPREVDIDALEVARPELEARLLESGEEASNVQAKLDSMLSHAKRRKLTVDMANQLGVKYSDPAEALANYFTQTEHKINNQMMLNGLKQEGKILDRPAKGYIEDTEKIFSRRAKPVYVDEQIYNQLKVALENQGRLKSRGAFERMMDPNATPANNLEKYGGKALRGAVDIADLGRATTLEGGIPFTPANSVSYANEIKNYLLGGKPLGEAFKDVFRNSKEAATIDPRVADDAIRSNLITNIGDETGLLPEQTKHILGKTIGGALDTAIGKPTERFQTNVKLSRFGPRVDELTGQGIPHDRATIQAADEIGTIFGSHPSPFVSNNLMNALKVPVLAPRWLGAAAKMTWDARKANTPARQVFSGLKDMALSVDAMNRLTTQSGQGLEGNDPRNPLGLRLTESPEGQRLLDLFPTAMGPGPELLKATTRGFNRPISSQDTRAGQMARDYGEYALGKLTSSVPAGLLKDIYRGRQPYDRGKSEARFVAEKAANTLPPLLKSAYQVLYKDSDPIAESAQAAEMPVFYRKTWQEPETEGSKILKKLFGYDPASPNPKSILGFDPYAY